MDILQYLSHLFSQWFFLDHALQLVGLSSVLALFLIYFLRGKKPKLEPLSWEEEEEIIANFQPEDLVPDSAVSPKRKVVQSRSGLYVTVDGQNCLNLATHNYLGYVEDDDVIQRAADSISQYGVGSCGPRGFYGTADVHLQLEQELAAFFGVEEACVYSYGFSTAASAISAYCKSRDVIFADEYVNFAIQKGFDASRSKIVYYKHNDMEDLEDLLKKQVETEKATMRRPRRFLVAEGIYQRTGDLCPLPELVALRSKYQLRMFLDEAVSFGTVGATGRGVMEHFNVPLEEVDLRIGSLEGVFGSVGGFCVGSSFIVEHQRLSGLGYCFSGSLPPLLAVAALSALDHLRTDTKRLEDLHQNCKAVHSAFSSLPGLVIGGDPISPIKMLYLEESAGYGPDLCKLSDLVEGCFARGLAILPPTCLPSLEVVAPRARLRVAVSALLDEEKITFAQQSLLSTLTAANL